MFLRKRFCLGLAAVTVIAGGSPVAAASGGAPAPNTCVVDVAPTAEMPMALNVTLRCAMSGGLTLRANSAQQAGFVGRVSDSGEREVPQETRLWRVPGDPSGIVTARYRFELDAYLDETNNDIDGMRRGGVRALLLGGWLLQPLSSERPLALSIAVDLPAGQNFAAGLPRSEDRYKLQDPVRLAGYTVFGQFEPIVVTVPPPPGEDNAAIHLVLLDANYAATPQQYADWVRQSARAIATYFDGFSSTRTLIVGFPARGRGVQFGRVVPSGGVTMALRLGIDEQARDLYQAWVLIHEMIHTAMPYVVGRGAWFMEGMATYLEPIIRSRVGWKSEDDVWREWIDNMPRGIGALAESGLLSSSGRGATYWGGALFMLLSDIEMRRVSGNKMGLEDCLRAVLRNVGNTTARVTVEGMIEACDKATGGSTMADMARRYVYKATPLDLMALWRDLGVALVDGKIVYDDAAPLASVRKAIVRGMRPPVLVPMGPA
jgi:hypothetical protein